tara:strand:- start:1142 stop:1486 length:345 start_codon:yes stop_codon:yes gene_type:complete
MLKVIRYKNFGSCMYGGKKNSEHQKFLFSFFELNNKKIISVMFAENWDQNKMMNYEFDSFVCNYNFGKKWSKWWMETFKNKSTQTDEITHKLVKKFYFENIFHNRYTKTKVISL